MTRQAARGVAARPPARLLRLHRHSLASLLVLGGTEIQRAQVAAAFHAASPLRRAPFLVLDCAREEARLAQGLQRWLIRDAVPAGPDPLRESDGGTLFLDEPACLSEPTQRMLLMLVRRLSGAGHDERGTAGPVRLAAGSSEDPAVTACRTRFVGALFDCLDKIRVDLGRAGRRGAA